MIQTRRTAKALVSTRRHGPLRNSRAPTEHQRSQKMGKWAHLWDTKKAMNHVFPAVICSPVLRSLWASAPLKALQTHFGFTPKTVVRCVRDQIDRHGRADAPAGQRPRS